MPLDSSQQEAKVESAEKRRPDRHNSGGWGGAAIKEKSIKCLLLAAHSETCRGLRTEYGVTWDLGTWINTSWTLALKRCGP